MERFVGLPCLAIQNDELEFLDILASHGINLRGWRQIMAKVLMNLFMSQEEQQEMIKRVHA